MRSYTSSLTRYITGLITQKQASGYIYEYEAYILESFDRFCVENHYNAGTITREMVMHWAIQRPTESKNYRNQRVSFVRQLARYMQSLGENAYIPKKFASETVEVPHVLSREELTSFFNVVDAYMPPQPSFRRLVPTYQVLIRLFYCCGLRLSEGCYLRRSCVDLKTGTLEILQSKGNKDRLVFLADDVLALCRTYDARMQSIIPDRYWFFSGRHRDRPLQKTSVDKKFGEFWNKTSYAGKVDKKPTVHCLRHTFVVDKMNEWMQAGMDTGAMMPYLSRYLGHSSIEETQYYFHTIEQAFPIVRQHDAMGKSVIPEVVVYEE
ncbi:MAG: integrase family protein [Spirochaetes bacterium]|nr:MAG: integrase family protein [Spirochaetota bacterium]